MKNKLLILGLIVVLALVGVVATTAFASRNVVFTNSYYCHIPAGNNQNGQVLFLSLSGWLNGHGPGAHGGDYALGNSVSSSERAACEGLHNVATNTPTSTPDPTATDTPEPTATNTDQPTATDEPTATQEGDPTPTEEGDPTPTFDPCVTPEVPYLNTSTDENPCDPPITTTPGPPATFHDLFQCVIIKLDTSGELLIDQSTVLHVQVWYIGRCDLVWLVELFPDKSSHSPQISMSQLAWVESPNENHWFLVRYAEFDLPVFVNGDTYDGRKLLLEFLGDGQIRFVGKAH